MKKIISFLLILSLVLPLASCSSKSNGLKCDDFTKVEGDHPLKIGMITDAGTIDDKAFNESTWKAIQCYKQLNGGDVKYQRPSGETETDYLASINNLIDIGYKIIVANGFKTETALYQAQTKYPDVTFILLDAIPNNGLTGDNYKEEIAKNSVAIHFAEEQAGFLAGVTAALSTTTNSVGFIGGMAIPTVKRFEYGYVAGIAYANSTFGTTADLLDSTYQGTFTDVQAGQTLAAGMYDKDIDIIFAAAGSVGLGVFNEAKTRNESKQKVSVIGVDVDQYDQGVYGDGSNSVTLTSALKRVDIATYNMLTLIAQDKFPGGSKQTMDLTTKGVGLPLNNPNLNKDILDKVNQIIQDVFDGKINIPSTYNEAIKFMDKYKFKPSSNINK